MSASAPRQGNAPNPAKFFLNWKGGNDQGHFEYYDKSIEDVSKKNVRADLSKGFFILDEDLFNVSGWDEPNKQAIISNEVRDIQSTLIIKAWKEKKSKVLHVGSYEDLKPVIQNTPAKYTKSIYALTLKGELINIQLHGKALQAWLEDVGRNHDRATSLVIHSSTNEGKKGAVKFKFPRFEVSRKATKKEWDQVLRIDSEILQPYLKEYLERNSGNKNEPKPEDSFDQKDWRNYRTESGVTLSELTFYQIKEMQDNLVDLGNVDSIVYDCVSQAILDYQAAIQTWPDKKDKSGKPLTDYTTEDLEAAYAKVPANHPSKIYIEMAIDSRKSKSPEEEFDSDFEEDDIPF